MIAVQDLAVVAAGALAGLASIPHCMGMCGPLVAGVCAGPRQGVGYQVGRTLSYGALGALAGGVFALGLSPLPRELSAQVLSATMALGLLWVAYRLASSALQKTDPEVASERDAGPSERLIALRPKATRPPTSPPSRWVRLVRPLLGSPLLVGGLSALLPCAALMNMGVLAGATGSATAGALTGVAFAATTGAGLATSVWAASLLRQSRTGALVVAGVLVLGAGIVTLRGMPRLMGGEGAGPACHVEPLANAGDVTP